MSLFSGRNFNKFKRIETVTMYLVKDNKVLLLYRNKKENDINHGKYIGVGGHIEEGETPEKAIVREVKEETNFDVINLTKRGIIVFYFIDEQIKEVMHLYVSNDYKGEQIIDCDEGTLEWVNIEDINKLPMWQGDKYFIDDLFKYNREFFQYIMEYKNGRLVNISAPIG